mmetsp:Transcript_5943/g.16486  ORF Transcript_5943/g.16486 Transcript_5943/m.16486 type:complete len:192 (+) Transcript_5943:81-656(+)
MGALSPVLQRLAVVVAIEVMASPTNAPDGIVLVLAAMLSSVAKVLASLRTNVPGGNLTDEAFGDELSSTTKRFPSVPAGNLIEPACIEIEPPSIERSSSLYVSVDETVVASGLASLRINTPGEALTEETFGDEPSWASHRDPSVPGENLIEEPSWATHCVPSLPGENLIGEPSWATHCVPSAPGENLIEPA